MNLLMCTSRGKGVKPLVNQHSIVFDHIIIRPGKSITTLAKEAIKIIHASPLNPSEIHVYFPAGLIDVTQK